MRAEDDLGATAEWYLTVRRANLLCRRLIAFQESVDQGDNLHLAIAIIGNPSVVCPHCKGDSFPPRSDRAASGCADVLRKRGGDQHTWDVVPGRAVLTTGEGGAKQRSAMSRKISMPVLWGAVGCAAALALLAGHGLAQQMEP
jgi:hypothetical protein